MALWPRSQYPPGLLSRVLATAIDLAQVQLNCHLTLLPVNLQEEFLCIAQAIEQQQKMDFWHEVFELPLGLAPLSWWSHIVVDLVNQGSFHPSPTYYLRWISRVLTLCLHPSGTRPSQPQLSSDRSSQCVHLRTSEWPFQHASSSTRKSGGDPADASTARRLPSLHGREHSGYCFI